MTANIKALLTSIRSMVVKMLPAYRFFTGRTTETTTTQICGGDVHCMLGARIAFPEGAITSFVEGDVYNLTVNGETHQLTVESDGTPPLFYTAAFNRDDNGLSSFPDNSGCALNFSENGGVVVAQGEYVGLSFVFAKEDGTVIYDGAPEYNLIPLDFARPLTANDLNVPPAIGDTYDVEINGVVSPCQLTEVEIDKETYCCLGTGTYDYGTKTLSPENSWLILFGDANPLYLGNGAYANATVSVSQSQTAVVEHYDTKKLPEECLPNSVAKTKDVNTAKAEAKSASADAAAARSAADAALNSAEYAKDTANSAKIAADNAKTAAETAQSTATTANTNATTAKNTADAAKVAADNAMAKTDPVCSGSFSQNRKSETAIGSCSHAEGLNSIASGDLSHAEGNETTASAYGSHAEGGCTTASGAISHAEGGSTTASGVSSHAEGNYTTASGENSHAEGFDTVASSENQHVQGRYNIEDSSEKYAHIVGNGTAGARSNAHTLDWSGVPWFQGRPQFGGTAQDNGSQTVMANGDKEITLLSSTASSTKKLTLSVNDSGRLIVAGSDGTTYTLGEKGDKGDKGDAYTLTDADKQTITSAVLAALPTWTGGDF